MTDPIIKLLIASRRVHTCINENLTVGYGDPEFSAIRLYGLWILLLSRSDLEFTNGSDYWRFGLCVRITGLQYLQRFCKVTM